MEEENITNDRLIDKYLAGTLSKEEERLFEKKRKHPEFKAALSQMQQIKAGLMTFELRRMKNMLQEEEEALKSPVVKKASENKSRFLFSNLLKIAAILLGLSLGAWWFITSFDTRPDYFVEYFTPQTQNVVEINRNSIDTSFLHQIYNYYDNGEYQKFLESIETIIVERNNDNDLFYQANALLATNQTEEAIMVLNQIVKNDQSQFTELSKWFLALSYLRKEQVEKARPLLENLAEGSEVQEEAQAILKTLD